GPVVMSGHQTEFWHAGILAKLLAASALARHIRGHAVWLHVDHDAGDPGAIRVPVRSPEGELESHLWRPLENPEPAEECPGCMQSPGAPVGGGVPTALLAQAAGDDVRAGLSAILNALRAESAQASAAARVGAATIALANDIA